MLELLKVTTKNEVETEVRREHEKMTEEEFKEIESIIKNSLLELKEQMKEALGQDRTFKQADVKVEIDLSKFLPSTVKRVHEAFQQAGWNTYYGETASIAVIKPY